jgi:alcohol dehydrogenase
MFCAQQIATGVNTPGSHAEYMVAYADTTTLLPSGISYEQLFFQVEYLRAETVG